MLLNHYACAQNMVSWKSSPDSPDPPDPLEMVSSRADPTLGSTRAGGQDDGSQHKLPQITARLAKFAVLKLLNDV